LSLPASKQHDFRTVGVTEDAQKDFGRLVSLLPRPLPSPRQNLSRVLIKAELKDAGTNRLAEVRTHVALRLARSRNARPDPGEIGMLVLGRWTIRENPS
jgi:hypothetical protein